MFTNILAIRNDRFGEFLLNIPAFRALKESNPGCRLTLLVNPYVQELAKCIEGVDEVIAWDNKKHSFIQLLKFSKQLRKKKFDLCVIFNPSRESNIISYMARIPVRVGYDRKWSFLLSRKIKDRKEEAKKHEVEYNLELAALAGARSEDNALSLSKNNDIINLIGDESDLIALHPWTSDPVKKWPFERFCKLIERLGVLSSKVVIIGAMDDIKQSQLLSGNKIVNLTGKTDLKQLASLLKKCRLLISCDSGPVHLASCVGTPVLALFRNDLPGKTATRWGPWGKNSFVIEKSSLEDITVEEVFNKAKEMLVK